MKLLIYSLISRLLFLILQGVKIYGVQAFEEEESTKFFDELVTITNGQHIKLSEFSNICDMILAICYREKGAEYLEVNSCTFIYCVFCCVYLTLYYTDDIAYLVNTTV